MTTEQRHLELFTELELRDVPGYEGHYAASYDGQIWSYPKGTRNPTGQWLTPFTRPDGYVTVNIASKYGKGNYMVHRLVAMAWHPNPNQLPEVNHIDSNRANNRADNLEWVSKSQNATHMHAAQRSKRDGPSDYMQGVINIREDRRLYSEFQQAFADYCAQMPPNNTATESRKLWHFKNHRRNVADHYTTRAQIRASVEELIKRR